MLSHPMYRVAIPSFGRAQRCNNTTLEVLHRGGVPAKWVFVFVANAAERHVYRATLRRDRYAALVVVGSPGVVAVRNKILGHWPAGVNVLSMDDDIREVDWTLSGLFGRTRSLHAFIVQAFAVCRRSEATLWGVYPVYNKGWMSARPEVTTDLRFIVGCFHGFVSRGPRGAVAVRAVVCGPWGGKEDIEITIRHYQADGCVVRFNRVGVVTKNYTVGGLGPLLAPRLRASESAVRALARAYPCFGRPWRRDHNGVWEFRLKNKPTC